jgi:hypothetical protein
LTYTAGQAVILHTRVVNQDLDWIRIQDFCGSGSGLGIRILDPDTSAIKMKDIFLSDLFSFL